MRKDVSPLRGKPLLRIAFSGDVVQQSYFERPHVDIQRDVFAHTEAGITLARGGQVVLFYEESLFQNIAVKKSVSRDIRQFEITAVVIEIEVQSRNVFHQHGGIEKGMQIVQTECFGLDFPVEEVVGDVLVQAPVCVAAHRFAHVVKQNAVGSQFHGTD